MAYDKVVDSAWLDEGLQSIADVIKEKAGITEALEFPDGIKAAAESIQTGDSIIDRSVTAIKNDTVTTIGANAFRNCSKLESVDLGMVTSIAANAFTTCSALVTLILRSDVVCTLANTNAFTGTPMASGTGYVYVPSALIDTYKTATNWATYTEQFRAIEDYTDITGG